MQGYRLTSFPVSAWLSEVSSCEFKPEFRIHWWRCTSRYVSGVSLNPAKTTSECSLLSVWLHRLKQNPYTMPIRYDFNPEETVVFCLNQMLKPTSEITTGRRPFSTGAAAPTSSRNPSLSQVCPTIIIRITFFMFSLPEPCCMGYGSPSVPVKLLCTRLSNSWLRGRKWPTSPKHAAHTLTWRNRMQFGFWNDFLL